VTERRGGIVAAGHPISAEAAAGVLRDGGNAFDATIAALWTACATEPVLASPGGGGFLLAQPAQGEATLYDFFVHTPGTRRKEEEFYPITVDFGIAQQMFHVGRGAVAVPGFVRGLFEVHREQGLLPMKRLVEPAIEAARAGVELTTYQAYLLDVVRPIFQITQDVREVFACDAESHGADSPPPRLKQSGERYCNSALAESLESLAAEGDGLFYEGDLAEKIEQLCLTGGGHVTRDDLSSYRVIRREPLRRRYRTATLELNPPPSSGGVLIAFSLELLSRFGLKQLGFGSAAHAELLLEVMGATNRARSEAVVDGVPRDDALGAELIEKYAREVAVAPAGRSGTTHVSVIDAAGNAASATVSNGEGCGHMVPGTGFMLNNMLGEDDLNPTGLGSWAPDKRMSSMMAPTAVRWDDGGFAVLGSGGSNRIRTAILQVITNLIDFEMAPEEAVNAPRLHLENSHLDFEALLPETTLERLADAFPDHTRWPERNMFFGGAHTVLRTAAGQLLGAGDPRRAGVSIVL
jgi:gamma-glutamyltranspeptidase/glutathione hydrolase